MHELIEQREATTITTGGSKAIIIPASWLQRLESTEETKYKLRLCVGKHGLFIDIYKMEE